MIKTPFGLLDPNIGTLRNQKIVVRSLKLMKSVIKGSNWIIGRNKGIDTPSITINGNIVSYKPLQIARSILEEPDIEMQSLPFQINGEKGPILNAQRGSFNLLCLDTMISLTLMLSSSNDSERWPEILRKSLGLE